MRNLNPKDSGSQGFVLALTLLLMLGITAITMGTIYLNKMGRMSSVNYKHKIQTFTASDGLITLLSQELINGNAGKYIDTTRTGIINGQMWTGVTGNNVLDLRDAMASQPSPNTVIQSNYLGSQMNMSDYGIKWSGYLIPPLSGSYTFYTRSDDASQFFLSTDASTGNLSSSPICQENGWSYQWPKSGTQVSKPIPLVGGNRYYFEYYHKQGGGFDIGQMGWDGPEYFAERPISGPYISQYSSDPAWAGTVNVGSMPVRYQVLGAGQNQYRVFTESIDIRSGHGQDTIFRTPLSQTISLSGVATAPPRTLWMRVIHYDFKSDGSNPEFDTPFSTGIVSGVIKNMVQTRLNYTNTDAAYFGKNRIGKPMHNQDTPNRSCGLDMWFKDWVPVHNVYKYDDNSDCNTTYFDPVGDKWFNKKYYDSLAFTLDPTQGPNTYVFSEMGNYNTGVPETSWRGDSTEYFPLDKYGNDPPTAHHNFAFCTELHTTFIYQSGLKFEFTGDDDVWAFINDSLVIDLGGLHVASNTFVNLDELTNLVFGQVYDFDLFQCERHEIHSSSRMVTNIKLIPPLGNPVANWKRDYGSLD